MGIRVIFFVASIFICHPIIAQGLKGEILFVDSNQSSNCGNKLQETDSLSLVEYFSDCIASFHHQGFLEARIDSFAIESNTVVGFGFKGKRYKYVFANPDSTSIYWMNRAGLKKQRSGKPLNMSVFVETNQKILSSLEKNGHPFSIISYQNTRFKGDTVLLDVRVNPGPLIRLDTLYVMGNTKISHQFVKSHLSYVKGNPYSIKDIEKYDQKLRDLGFLKVIRPTEVEFIPGKVRVYSYLEDKPASQFSGLVGFASPEDGSPGIKFTGDVNLRLTNLFKHGERNIVQWQALGEGTQRLNLSTAWSYLFGSRIGINAQFKLFRRDTTYLNVNPRVDVDFVLPNGSSIGIGFDYRKSSTIAASASQNIANVSTSLYRLSFKTGLITEDIFPVRYFWAYANLGIGSRKGVVSLVDPSKPNSTIGEIGAKLKGYYPLYNPNVVLHLRLHGEMLQTISSVGQSIEFLDNEMYRIGGINTIRGFNQESIIANAYSVGTVELQFRLKNLLNMYLFYDHSVVSTSQLPASQYSWPYGVGFGFQLVSVGGLLNFSYGIGKGMGEDLLLQSAKLHIGYIANF